MTGSDRSPVMVDPGAAGSLGTASPRFALRDVMAEAVAGMLARPGRTVLTILGTVLGIAALVATLGISKTAGNQIVGEFDALAATSVSVRPQQEGGGFFGPGRQTVSVIPFDAEARLVRLNGVESAGTLSSVDTGSALARSVPVNDPLGQSEFAMTVFAASPGLFDAVGAELLTGRTFDAAHDTSADNVAVLGPGAAQRLNINRVDQQPAVFLGDETLVVVGILSDVQTEAGLLDSIVVPAGYARERLGLEAPAEVHIRTVLGGAQLIAEQAPIALSPNEPGRLRVVAPPDPASLQSRVESEVNSLFVILGGVSLLVGAIGIANVTLVSVLERVGEIGLRRSLGAARRHIAGQFLAESAGMGLVGGIVGASAGVLVVVVVSATRTWTPVLDAWVPLAAPFLGLLVGVVSGLYPAWRAASLEPVQALRGG